MHVPQVVLIVLLAVNWATALAKHGQPRGAYNVLYTTIDAVIVALLLWWGGFFSH